MAVGNRRKKVKRKEKQAMAKTQQGACGPDDKGKGTTHTPAMKPAKKGR